jgi:ligand-binding sensor domain-containing protein
VHRFGGGDLRAIAEVGDDIVAAGIADGLVKVDRGRLVTFAGPHDLAVAETLASAHDATCAGGLAGAWVKRDSTWTHAAHRAGPPSNDISALAIDGDALLVGTFDHGLARFAHGAWTTIERPELDARINAILVDGPKIWVGTAEGLTILEGTGASRLTRRDGLASRSVLSLAKSKGGILVGTSQGASLFGDGHPVRLGPKAPAGSGQNIESIGNVWAMAEDAAGWIWLGTTTGLYRGHAGDTEWQRFGVVTGHLKDDWVVALALHGDALYVGTYNGGVAKLVDTTATHVTDGWVNPGGLLVDGDRIYASTQDGLKMSDGAAWTDAGKLPGKDVTGAIKLGGTLYVATRRGLATI